MPEKLNFLTDEDVRMLSEMKEWWRTQARATPRMRQDVSSDDITAPDIYVAKTPEGGIGGLTCEGCMTGTGTNIQARFAMCPIYRVLETGVHQPAKIRPLPGKFKRVFNLSTAALAGNSFVVVERDKYGTWLVRQSDSTTFDPCAVDCRKPAIITACIGNCWVQYQLDPVTNKAKILQRDCDIQYTDADGNCRNCCGDQNSDNSLCGTGSFTNCTVPDRLYVTTEIVRNGAVCPNTTGDTWCVLRGTGPGTYDCGGGVSGYSWSGPNSLGTLVVTECQGLWCYNFPVSYAPVVCGGWQAAVQTDACDVWPGSSNGAYFTGADGVERVLHAAPNFGCGFYCWQNNTTGTFSCSGADESGTSTVISGPYSTDSICVASCTQWYCWKDNSDNHSFCSANDESSTATQASGPYASNALCTASCTDVYCWVDGSGYCHVCSNGDPSSGYPPGTTFGHSSGPYPDGTACANAPCEVVYCIENLQYDDSACTVNETSLGFQCNKPCPGFDGTPTVDETACHPGSDGIHYYKFSIVGGPYNSFGDCSSLCPPS